MLKLYIVQTLLKNPIAKLQILKDITQGYMQWLTSMSKPKGSKLQNKAQKIHCKLKIHFITTLELSLDQKSMSQGQTQARKNYPNLNKIFFAGFYYHLATD